MWVIDNEHLSAFSSHSALSAHRIHAAAFSRVPAVGCRGVAGDLNPQLPRVLLDGVSYLAAPGCCIIGLVRGQDDPVLGEEVEKPDREPVRDKGRFAMPRRHADDEARIAAGHGLGEQKGQLTKVAVEPPPAA